MNFNTTKDYLRAFERDPAAGAIMPIQMIADLRGVTRGAIVHMIDTGQLRQIKIEKTRYIQTASFVAYENEIKRRTQIVYSFLEDLARQRRTCFYDPVMSCIGLRWQTPADRQTIGAMLGQISRETVEDNGILLSVLVHKKSAGRSKPGNGFFELAAGLGYEWDDPDEFVEEEIQKVWALYAKPARVVKPMPGRR